MRYGMYAVKDEMSNSFFHPALVRTEEEAIRAFKSQVNHTQIWADNPEDFSLYCVGYYNDENGVVESELCKVIGGRAVKE